MQDVELLSLPCTSYVRCWDLQRARVAWCRESRLGSVIFVEHPAVVTLGRAGRRGSLLASEAELAGAGIDLVHSDRGGDITYHGPGQLVVYPVLDLGLWKKDVYQYLRALEEVTLQTLLHLGITGRRSNLGSGVWASSPGGDSRKIASLGVHLSRWVTSHGLALNVSNSLEPFRHIAACGLPHVQMTSVSELLGRPVARETVETTLWTHLKERFGLRPIGEVRNVFPTSAEALIDAKQLANIGPGRLA